MYRILCIVGLAGLLLALTTHQAVALCPPSSFNFFPPNTNNQPSSWSRANQTAAGNFCDGHLLPIATYGFPKPLLHFQPLHTLLTAGTPISSLIVATLSQRPAVDQVVSNSSSNGNSSSSGSSSSVVAASQNTTANTSSTSNSDSLRRSFISSAGSKSPYRQLLSDSSSNGTNAPAADSLSSNASNDTATDTSNWTVSTPALYNVTVTANGRIWYQSGPYNVSNGDIPVVNFDANVSQGRRDLFDPLIFKEGINTIVIFVTLLQGTGSVTNGTTVLAAPHQHESFSSPPIDFYFFMSNATHDSRPRATVKVHSCSTDVTIEFTNTRPRPAIVDGYRLTHTPSNTSNALFLPTYYVYGSFLQGLDGSTGLETDNTDGNVKNFGLHVTKLPGAPDAFTVESEQLNALKEGWYSLTVEGSLWVPNEHLHPLVSVAGVDIYSQKDTTYIAVQANGTTTTDYSLFNGFKGAGWVLPEYNQTRIGIQKYESWLQVFQGPDTALTLGSKATFQWEFTGLGNTSCEINGVNVNPLTGLCTSPLTYTIATTLNQTLMINFTDVCAVSHTASMTFGPFGWEVNGGNIYELGASSTLAPSMSDMSVQRNSATGLRSQRATYKLLGLLAAVVVILLL